MLVALVYVVMLAQNEMFFISSGSADVFIVQPDDVRCCCPPFFTAALSSAPVKLLVQSCVSPVGSGAAVVAVEQTTGCSSKNSSGRNAEGRNLVLHH